MANANSGDQKDWISVLSLYFIHYWPWKSHWYTPSSNSFISHRGRNSAGRQDGMRFPDLEAHFQLETTESHVLELGSCFQACSSLSEGLIGSGSSFDWPGLASLGRSDGEFYWMWQLVPRRSIRIVAQWELEHRCSCWVQECCWKGATILSPGEEEPSEHLTVQQQRSCIFFLEGRYWFGKWSGETIWFLASALSSEIFRTVPWRLIVNLGCWLLFQRWTSMQSTQLYLLNYDLQFLVKLKKENSCKNPYNYNYEYLECKELFECYKWKSFINYI